MNSPLCDLDLLRALVMVADCGSFTTASARLHSTQSTVSQKVRRLEEIAGHRLLDRATDSYRPERHYMRGPGPKWRAKHRNRTSVL